MISNIHKKSGKRKRIVFFGDSITQQAQDPINDGWISCLGNWWTRRVDVINRGFSGYNTKYAVLIVQRAVIRERPDLVVVFFGANDAAIPQSTQHVPLEEYHLNLLFIIAEIKQSYPNVPLLLVTPPPVWETAVEERNRGYGNAIALDRTNERYVLTVAYVLLCVH